MQEGSVSLFAWWALHFYAAFPIIFSSNNAAGVPRSIHSSFSIYFIVHCIFFVYVRKVNPGFLQPDDQRCQNFDIFEQSNIEANCSAESCSKCKILRLPEGAKHCFLCHRCVEGFDHHCAWLGTCVGKRNHKFFLAYLGSELVLDSTALYIVFQSLIIPKWSDGQPIVIFVQTCMCILHAVFIIICVACMISMFAYHSYLVSNGLNTRDLMKRWRNRNELSIEANISTTDLAFNSQNVALNFLYVITGRKNWPCLNFIVCRILFCFTNILVDNQFYSIC